MMNDQGPDSEIMILSTSPTKGHAIKAHAEERKVRNWRTKLFAILFCCLATDVVLAQVSEDYDLSWNMISSGGGTMSSANYAMSSTVGQTTGLLDSNDYQLGAGYWYRTVLQTDVKPTEEVPIGTDSDGDGWTDQKEREMGTNPYSNYSDDDGIKDPEYPNPTVPDKKNPGFESLFAITGLLTVAYILRLRK